MSTRKEPKVEPVPESMVPQWPDEPETETEFTVLDDVPPTAEEPMSLIPMVVPDPGQTHHLVVGMDTLAAMSEEEFTAKLAIMRKGQERIKIIMESLLVEGEDYGRVKGIDRPFLHQPGAEKLSKFYGLAVRQEAERIIGDGVTAPPLAYHVKSFVHLGDFDGPIIAMGYGEASSWEEKYRYRWEYPKCPECGHGLIKRKSPPQMAGKWNCPNWGGKDGCNRVFEPNDERIKPAQRVDNEDPFSMAETLVQMAAKRSLVASIRRATGTSGLFTQDDDSPSVRQQSGDAPVDDREPEVKAGPAIEVAVGGKTAAPTPEQLRRLVALSKEKDIGIPGMVSLFERLFGIEVEETSAALSVAAKALTADQLGKMLWTMETGEVPSEAASLSQQPSTDPAAGATLPTGGQTTPPPDTSTGDDKSIILEADGMPA